MLVSGRCRLAGEVSVSGSKNAALPILAAALLTDEECVFENVPCIGDVQTMLELLARLGCAVEFDVAEHRVKICARNVQECTAPADLVTKMRASFLVTGPLLARFGRSMAPHPGGCAIGVRPKNVDVKGFAAMGASIDYVDGNYLFKAKSLGGTSLYLDYPSHTGTENLLMAASLAKGKTIIKNACVEPEVVALADCLKAMGAKVEGAGSYLAKVEGVGRLHGAHYRMIPDRLEAGTFAIAAALTYGEVLLRDVDVSHLDPLTHKLREVGITVEEGEDTYLVRGTGHREAVEVQTLHYPGFPTDLQALFAVLLTQAKGTSFIHERVFDDRLQYASQLRKMGAEITVEGQRATIKGPTLLKGTTVQALDIRSGAALILAGLVAEGKTEILEADHVDRGYERIDEKLNVLGAQIQRV